MAPKKFWKATTRGGVRYIIGKKEEMGLSRRPHFASRHSGSSASASRPPSTGGQRCAPALPYGVTLACESVRHRKPAARWRDAWFDAGTLRPQTLNPPIPHLAQTIAKGRWGEGGDPKSKGGDLQPETINRNMRGATPLPMGLRAATAGPGRGGPFAASGRAPPPGTRSRRPRLSGHAFGRDPTCMLTST